MNILALMSYTLNLKDGSVGSTTIYLDAENKKYQVKSGKSHWSMSSTQYMKNAVRMVEGLFRMM